MKQFVKAKKKEEEISQDRIDKFIDYCNKVLERGKLSFNNALGSKVNDEEIFDIAEPNETEFILIQEQARKNGYMLKRKPDNYQTTSYYFSLLNDEDNNIVSGIKFPDVSFYDTLKPYKKFPNEDYYRGYQAGLPEGAKAMRNEVIKLNK